VVAVADLKTIPWPTEQLPTGAYETPDQVTGNTVFDPIDQGEPVLASRLASSQSGGGSGVPTGMRAVSIHVTDSTGVLALLKSGQKVDVQVVVGRGSGKDVETEVRTALEGLAVLSLTPSPSRARRDRICRW
jgi:Flp pilus assembly protein CpaB